MRFVIYKNQTNNKTKIKLKNATNGGYKNSIRGKFHMIAIFFTYESNIIILINL